MFRSRFPRPLARALLLFASSGLLACGAGTYELVGTVERRNLELAAPISEIIVDIPTKAGERVEAGAVVVQLDTEVAEAELRAHEAARAAAGAALVEAEEEFKRAEGLRRARISTPQALAAARRQRDEALAMVAEKEARIAQANRRLRDLTVRSHAAGVVDQLPYEVGERAPAGGVVAVVLADAKPWVRVWLPARAVSSLGAQARAEIRVEGLEEVLHGHVEDVSREPEFTPHYALTERESAHLVYQSRVVIEDGPEGLRPGLAARVRLQPGGK